MLFAIIDAYRDKRPPSSPHDGSQRAAMRLVILRRYRDKKPPSSPDMEPESGQAVVKFAICRGVRSRPGFAPSGTQIGADLQHRAVMSETQNRQETPHDALPARNKFARCSARNRRFLSTCAPIIFQFGAYLRHLRFWLKNNIAPSPIIVGLETILNLHTSVTFAAPKDFLYT